ncbi:hypothetical protein D3C80_1573750 [compost metagenome]
MIVTGHRQATLQDLVELIFAFGIRVGGVQRLILLGDTVAQRLDALAAAQRGDAVDALIVEHQSADPIPCVEHHPRRQGAEFGGDRRFEAALRAKEHRHALIHENQCRAVTLLSEGTHHRFAGAQRGAPVEVTQIIAGLVATQFVEIQTTAAQA